MGKLRVYYLKTLNKLSTYPLGNTPSAPSEVWYTLHAHEFAILIQHVQVCYLVISRPSLISHFPEDLELASLPLTMVHHDAVNDPFIRLLSKSGDLDRQSSREASVVIRYVWSQ